MVLTLKDVQVAQTRIADYVKRTPILRAEKLDRLLNCQAYFKPESLQITGSFKLRGASSKILSLTEEGKERGIIASSSGNHALGVAYAAKQLGVRAVLVLPENAPETKIEGTKALGAEVVLHGFDSIERYKKLYELQAEKGYTLVHSYDDPMLIAGQGTVGLEIAEDLPDVDAVVVPLGGGGLLAGAALALKQALPQVKVIGVEPRSIPRYSASRLAGKRLEVPMKHTIADGLMITRTGDNTWPLIEQHVDDIVTVDDQYIYMALNEIVFKTKVLVESSAAIGVAAALSGQLGLVPGQKVCFVLTGGNIDPDTLIRFIEVRQKP